MGLRVQWYNADGLRWCSGCQDYLPVEQFTKHRTSSAGDGLRCYCVECHSRSHSRYHRTHREARQAAARSYRQRHPKTYHRTLRDQWHMTEARKRLDAKHARERGDLRATRQSGLLTTWPDGRPRTDLIVHHPKSRQFICDCGRRHVWPAKSANERPSVRRVRCECDVLHVREHAQYARAQARAQALDQALHVQP